VRSSDLSTAISHRWRVSMTAISQQDPRLTPARPEEVVTALRLICNSLRPIEGSDIEMTLAGYRVALEGCPAWAIANAVRRFLQGKVPHQSKVFCPKPPE